MQIHLTREGVSKEESRVLPGAYECGGRNAYIAIWGPGGIECVSGGEKSEGVPGLELEGVYGDERLFWGVSLAMAVGGPVLEDAEGRSGARTGWRG